VSFEDAARRTAQIANDVGFDGAPIFYSWPSRANTAQYTFDEASVEYTEQHLQQFLADVVSRSGAENIYLVAHSMGNRALTRAFIRLVDEQPELAARIKEVILTAPDIDADVFRQQIVPGLVKLHTPVTLYASSKDLALEASEHLHGYARAGDSGDNLIILPGMDTIDASAVDASLLGHSYVADSVSVLDDLKLLFMGHAAAAARGDLKPVEVSGQKYWALEP
jgi:esterase/lipase superfamily enzyme